MSPGGAKLPPRPYTEHSITKVAHGTLSLTRGPVTKFHTLGCLHTQGHTHLFLILSKASPHPLRPAESIQAVSTPSLPTHSSRPSTLRPVAFKPLKLFLLPNPPDRAERPWLQRIRHQHLFPPWSALLEASSHLYGCPSSISFADHPSGLSPQPSSPTLPPDPDLESYYLIAAMTIHIGETQNSTHYALFAELYMQISSWHFPLNILQSLELNLSKIEFIILLHNPPRVPLRSSPTSQKAGDGTWLFPSHSISSELLLLNLHSAHHGPAPWPLSSSKLRLLPPGITAGGWGPWPLSHQAGENFSMCTSNYITHQFKTQQWLPTTLETKL